MAPRRTPSNIVSCHPRQLPLCIRSLNRYFNSEKINIQKMEHTYAHSKVAASLPSLHQIVPPSLRTPARSLLGVFPTEITSPRLLTHHTFTTYASQLSIMRPQNSGNKAVAAHGPVSKQQALGSVSSCKRWAWWGQQGHLPGQGRPGQGAQSTCSQAGP